MARAYRIKRYDHVTAAKRRRLLEEDLVPLLAGGTDAAPDIANFLKEGDWLVDYDGSNQSFYVYRFKLYRYIPRLHLYVKHFAETDIVFRISSSMLNENTQLVLSNAGHLEVLPEYIFEMLEIHSERAKTDLDEKLKQLITKLKLRRNTLTPLGTQILRDIETGRISKARLKELLTYSDPNMLKNVMDQFPDMTKDEMAQGLKNIALGQWEVREKLLFNLEDYNRMKNAEKSTKVRKESASVELVDPTTVTGAISRAILEGYMKKHGGRLPTVKEFNKLTKKTMSCSGRRWRNH